jgi:hypothetical protein
MVINLPPEIWHSIGYHLHKKDLSSICQSSRYILRVIRPLIFRKLELIGTDPKASEYLNLLLREGYLAECIRTFSIGNCPRHVGFRELSQDNSIRNLQLLVADFLLKMTLLTSLKIHGLLFSTSEEQQSFVKGYEDREHIQHTSKGYERMTNHFQMKNLIYPD